MLISPVSIGDMANQLNRLFGLLADRIDKLEGLRGTPTFYADLDLQNNKATNAAGGVASDDLATKNQVQASQFPVGAIFLSMVITNPNTLLGYGTWAVVGTGKLHIGTGTGGAGLVGSFGTGIENVATPRTVVYIWQRTA